MSQIKEKVSAMLYKEVKEAALEIIKWRDLHQLHQQEQRT